MPKIIVPLSVILIAVGPEKDAFSLSESLTHFSFILIAVGPEFELLFNRLYELLFGHKFLSVFLDHAVLLNAELSRCILAVLSGLFQLHVDQILIISLDLKK
jgi:hypothetical protein